MSPGMCGAEQHCHLCWRKNGLLNILLSVSSSQNLLEPFTAYMVCLQGFLDSENAGSKTAKALKDGPLPV